MFGGGLLLIGLFTRVPGGNVLAGGGDEDRNVGKDKIVHGVFSRLIVSMQFFNWLVGCGLRGVVGPVGAESSPWIMLCMGEGPRNAGREEARKIITSRAFP